MEDYSPSRSRLRKWALQRRHVLFPSLWFNAWRCKCSDLENDFPQAGKVQQNFFLMPSLEVLEELVVEAEEMDAERELLVEGMFGKKALDVREEDDDVDGVVEVEVDGEVEVERLQCSYDRDGVD